MRRNCVLKAEAEGEHPPCAKASRMLLGCGAAIAFVLMVVGGMLYEEIMMHFGAGVARGVISVLAVVLIALVVKLITARAPAA